MHNPIIYKEIGINIISPTTSVCAHSSFPKEENRVTIAYNYSSYYCVQLLPRTPFSHRSRDRLSCIHWVR